MIERWCRSSWWRLCCLTGVWSLFNSMVWPALAEDWPRFRGPQSSGVSHSKRPLPVEVSPESCVIWKAKVPPGHSSPILTQDRIFLTTAEGDKLATVALDRATGSVL